MYECTLIKVHIHINKFRLRWCKKLFCNLGVQQPLVIANCPKLLGFWQNQTAWRPKTNDFQIKMYINVLLLKRTMFQTQLVIFVHVSLKTPCLWKQLLPFEWCHGFSMNPTQIVHRTRGSRRSTHDQSRSNQPQCWSPNICNQTIPRHGSIIQGRQGPFVSFQC